MKWHRDRFIEQLANLWVPMNYNTPNGKKATTPVQVLLQPIELWSLVFPEENLDKILRTLTPDKQIGIDNDFGTSSPKRKWALSALRKGLGLKKIPDFSKEGTKFAVYKSHIQTIGIGIKEDYRDENGNECL